MWDGLDETTKYAESNTYADPISPTPTGFFTRPSEDDPASVKPSKTPEKPAEKVDAVLVETVRKSAEPSCGNLVDNGIGARSITHGFTRDYYIPPEYQAWCLIKKRCYNKKYERFDRYGGRGIRVCDRWLHSFPNFYADLGPRPSPKHSIDRIDNDGNYEPGNVRWATRTEQNRNRASLNLITAFGETMCASAWAERMGIQRRTLTRRLERGWSAEDALSRPVSAPSPVAPSVGEGRAR